MKKQYSLILMTVISALTVLMVSPPSSAIVMEEWALRTFNPWHGEDYPNCMAVDSAGNIYVAGIGSQFNENTDYAVLKFAPDGSTIWRAYYDGGGYDRAYAMILDAAGNCYVTGRSGGFGGYPNYDFATVKFSPEGQQQWVARYDCTPDGEGGGVAIVLDAEGSVYVTGSASEGVYTSDYITIKYDSLGVQQWIVRSDYNDEADHPLDLAVDGAGCVYVTGYSGNGWNPDFLTYKYDASGNPQWSICYNGTANGNDRSCGLVLDESANVYVSGYCGTGGYGDFITFKYDSAGVLLWQDQFDSPNNWDDEAMDLALDSDRNLIVTGWSGWWSSDNSWLTVKYTEDGTLLWAKEHISAGNYGPRPNAMAVDPEGNIYITGSDCPPAWTWPGPESCHTIKYDSQGNLIWVATYHWPPGDFVESIGNDIVVDPWGNAIVASSFYFTECMADHDILTIKYHEEMGDFIVGMVPQVSPILIPASGGSFNYHLMTINNVMDSLTTDYWWQVVFPHTNSKLIGIEQNLLPLDSTAVAINQNVPAQLSPGNYQYVVYVGEYPGIVWASDTLAIRKLPGGESQIVDDWRYTLSEIESEESTQGKSSQPSTIIIHPCSPNPFNPTTTISFDLPVASQVKLDVFDINGRIVGAHSRAPLQYSPGTHSISFDGSNQTSGIYLYRLTAGEFTASGKMVLMK